MRNAIILMSAFFVFISLVQCSKSANRINISGYTATDEQGRVTSVDSSDWKDNVQIPSTVINILNGIPIQNSGSATGTTSCASLVAYPNPCRNSFGFSINNTCLFNYCMKYIIVDDNLHVYESNSLLCSNQSVLASVDVSSLSPGLYRLYYGFYNENKTLVGQGYGDIQKN